jgi:hypothetical protein
MPTGPHGSAGTATVLCGKQPFATEIELCLHEGHGARKIAEHDASSVGTADESSLSI